MRVWRICRAPYAAETLLGRGGLFAGGRWHTRGRPIVYTSQSLSLSALEVLVHVDRSSVPGDLVRVEIEIPDALKNQRIEVKGLPRNWRSYPAPAALQRLGDGWLTENATAVLRVPSSLIPQESNFLVNPQHPDAGKIALISSAKFAYDARLNP